MDTSPTGTPGGRANWVDKAGGFGPYMRGIIHALKRKGMDESRAVATAWSALRRMAAGIGPSGKGHVTPKVQAAAGAELAHLEAMRAKARAS